MARTRKSDASILTGLSTVFGGLYWVGSKLFTSIVTSVRKKRGKEARLADLQTRLAYLRNKYQDEVLVQRMMQGQLWPGQTADQLQDSMGLPISVDNILLKTRKREVWKYDQTGVNRYRIRITLDDDVVVSWDQKN